MLSTSSNLQQGRYRILRNIWPGPGLAAYDAADGLFAQNITIFEMAEDHGSGDRSFEERFNSLKAFGHEAVIGVRDHFSEGRHTYVASDTADGISVTEWVESTDEPFRVGSVVHGAVGLLDALTKMTAAGKTSFFGLTPGHVRVIGPGDLKLLSYGVESNRTWPGQDLGETLKSGFSFAPLEMLWQKLDLASQKAISHAYEDRSLEILESRPDARSDVYTLGSIIYFLVTGKLAADPLERSIEILDGKADPLQDPAALNSGVSPELSAFLRRAMCLKREDRFESFAEALDALSPLDTAPLEEPVRADLFDDADLLEIPGFSAAPVSVIASKPAPATVAVPTVAIGNGHSSVVPSDPIPERRMWPEPVRPDFLVQQTPPRTEDLGFVEKDRLPEVKAAPVRDLRFSSAEERGKRWPFIPVAIVAAVLLLIAVGGWVVTSMNSSGRASAVEQRDTKSSVVSEPPRNDMIDAPASTEPAADTSDGNNNLNQAATPMESRTSAQTAPASKSKPAANDTKQPRDAKTPAPAASPKTKKKVTVDDLINDN